MISSKLIMSLIEEVVLAYNENWENEKKLVIVKPRKLRQYVEAGIIEYLQQQDHADYWFNNHVGCLKQVVE